MSVMFPWVSMIGFFAFCSRISCWEQHVHGLKNRRYQGIKGACERLKRVSSTGGEAQLQHGSSWSMCLQNACAAARRRACWVYVGQTTPCHIGIRVVFVRYSESKTVQIVSWFTILIPFWNGMRWYLDDISLVSVRYVGVQPPKNSNRCLGVWGFEIGSVTAAEQLLQNNSKYGFKIVAAAEALHGNNWKHVTRGAILKGIVLFFLCFAHATIQDSTSELVPAEILVLPNHTQTVRCVEKECQALSFCCQHDKEICFSRFWFQNKSHEIRHLSEVTEVCP